MQQPTIAVAAAAFAVAVAFASAFDTVAAAAPKVEAASATVLTAFVALGFEPEPATRGNTKNIAWQQCQLATFLLQ